MVKILVFLMLISFNLNAEDIVVTSEMNYTQLFAGSPLTGTITITHDRNNKVDINSFKLGSNPLKVSFLNEVAMSEQSPLVVSAYSFEIPTLPKGLHILPQVSVKVGNKTYTSFSRSFEVFGSDKSRSAILPQAPTPQTTAPQTASQTSTPAQQQSAQIPGPIEGTVLRLEAKVEGPTSLYPGEQTKLTYKYLYKGHIDLTKEVIPLLEGFGLKKVGDKLTREYEENGLNVSEFSQVFEGEAAGKFTFGPSIIEGRAFQENAGRKIYSQTPLQSEVAPITIEVLPFPPIDKPASFNGSVGSYTFKASLNDGTSVNSGDKITLLLEITGDPKFMSTVKAPDLCCQPGFSGNFKPSDLPPISSLSGNTKRFLVDLKPLSPSIKEIPSIEFSSFDPIQKKYLIVKSSPIPLTVSLKTPDLDKKQPNLAEQVFQQDETLKNPQPIDIQGNTPLTKSDLNNQFGGSWWNLLWLPVLAVIFFALRNFKKETAEKKPEVKVISGEELFKSALAKEVGSQDFYRLLQKAMMTALWEKREIASPDIEPELLQKTGLQGEVRIFITRINELRFSGNRQFDQAIISSAKELFGKIKGA